MKKYILLLISVFFLFSCFGKDTENNEVENTKKKILGEIKTENTSKDISGEEVFSGTTEKNLEEDENISLEDEKESKTEENYIEINSLTDEQFLKLDNLETGDFKNFKKEITGKTIGKVDKIEVSFSNYDSNFPDDTFKLKKFKAGDYSFLYRAFKKYEVLDYGKNIYTFKAYSGDKISELELIVNLVKEKKIVKNIDISDLPNDSDFGTIKTLKNGEINYKNIDSLTMMKVGDIDLRNDDSDSVTKYLATTSDGYFYWNSLRPINDKEGVTFFVVKLNDSNYTYSKHYYNENGFYGILKLESGDLDGKTLKELNDELKEKNGDFEGISKVDYLFKKITN